MRGFDEGKRMLSGDSIENSCRDRVGVKRRKRFICFSLQVTGNGLLSPTTTYARVYMRSIRFESEK